MSLRRVGIYGGAFDPLHEGHLAVAQAATEYLQLDQLLWVPTGKPSHKQMPQYSFDERCKAIQAKITKNKRWKLSAIEESGEQISYTANTLQELCTDKKAMYFTIIGADQALTLLSWHQLDTILSLSHIAIAPRESILLPDTLPDVLKKLWQPTLPLSMKKSGLLLPIPMTEIDIHSEELRENHN